MISAYEFLAAVPYIPNEAEEKRYMDAVDLKEKYRTARRAAREKRAKASAYTFTKNNNKKQPKPCKDNRNDLRYTIYAETIISR